jgi:hypothetical protein
MEFKINQLDRTTGDNIVYTAHWTATKTDGDAVASVYSSMALEAGDTIIPYEQLTEEVVVNWVKEKLDLESLEASLDAQIAEQKQPTKASGLPWATE